MSEQLTVLFAAFILTTVGGGLLGYYLQNRSWKHQYNVKLLENERATATEVFEQVSKLLDKRLYRMRKVAWNFENAPIDTQIIEESMNQYRELLYEWNDTLIRNLALVQAYFGNASRNLLEDSIYEEFKRIGILLEEQYKEIQETGHVAEPTLVIQALSRVTTPIYQLNFNMIGLIQKGLVGLFHPDTPDNIKL